MTASVVGFVVIASVLTLLAAVAILPLTGIARAREQPESINVALLQDEYRRLDEDLRIGLIDEAESRLMRAELERRVLIEGKNAREVRPTHHLLARRSSRWMTWALVAVVPLGAGLIYALVGAPSTLLDHPLESRTAELRDVEQLVEKLAATVKERPTDLEGWTMLARAYYSLKRFQESADTFAHARTIAPNEPTLMVDQADALAGTLRGNLSGAPLLLIQQALRIEPNLVKGLMLAGSEAFDRKDFASATYYWERASALIPKDSTLSIRVNASIAEARARTERAAASSSITGVVKLAPSLVSRISNDDTLFIVARDAVDGRPPRAVIRGRAADIPFKFTIDDSHAMSEAFKLSGARDLQLVVRISKSGNAAPMPGDLEGRSAVIAVGAREVVVTIDRVIE